MITSAIINAFSAFVEFIGNFLPNGAGVSDNFQDSFELLYSYMYGLDWLFPVTEAMQIFRWSILIYFGIFLYKSLNWTLNKLRGSGGNG